VYQVQQEQKVKRLDSGMKKPRPWGGSQAWEGQGFSYALLGRTESYTPQHMTKPDVKLLPLTVKVNAWPTVALFGMSAVMTGALFKGLDFLE